MTDRLDLLKRIENEFSTFSKGQKRIATFILNHYDKAAYLTASKLGEFAEVSESTVVRFACELGYEGYPELQQDLEILVRTKLTDKQRMKLTSSKLENEKEHILKTVLQDDLTRIQHTINCADYDTFDKAVEAIFKARNVYVIGGRSSLVLSNFFAFYLNIIKENVVNVNSGSETDMFEAIFRANEEDVFVLISFPRYSQKTIKALQFGTSKKIKTIAITDSKYSPLYAFADYSLIAKADLTSFLDSLVAPLSLINAILTALSIRNGDELNKNFTELEDIWKKYQIKYYSNQYSSEFEDEE